MIPKFDSNAEFFNYMQKRGWNFFEERNYSEEELEEARNQVRILLKQKREKMENDGCVFFGGCWDDPE